MRDFELEKHFSKWEFTARWHMTASDLESMSVADLLAMGTEADREALQTQWLGYTETWGAPPLREEISKTYNTLNASDVLCFAGINEGIYSVMRSLLKKSDHVIVVVPNYQSSETVPLEICQVSGVRLREDDDWRIDFDDLRAALRPNTRLIAINFPNNPTGTIVPHQDLEELVALCRDHNLYLFSDEVYRLVELDDSDRLPQVADIYEKGISINVMSKAYGLAGLRVGWIASKDREVLEKTERYKHYLSICNSAPSEVLSLIALRNRDKILDRNRGLVRNNFEKLAAFVQRHGNLFSWTPPKGGCVAFIRYTGDDGVEEFCRRMVENHGVLLLPASIYRSELLHYTPPNFRIGFGRAFFAEGLQVLENALD